MTSTISPSATSCIAFVSNSADAAGLAAWMRRLRKLRTTLSVLEVSGPVEQPLGVAPGALDGVAGQDRVTIVGVRGADREAVSRRLHERGRGSERVFFAIDGAVAGAGAVVKSLVDELRAAAGDDELSGGTLFVDEAQELGADALEALRGVADTGFVLHLGVEPAAEDVGGHRIEVKPLAERREDILPLVQGMLATYGAAPRLEADALEYLRDAAWPGDVEELRLVIHRLATTARGAAVTRADVAAVTEVSAAPTPVEQSLADLEREHIYRVLQHNDWNRTRSARSLGIDVKTLYNKLKRYEASSSAAAGA